MVTRRRSKWTYSIRLTGEILRHTLAAWFTFLKFFWFPVLLAGLIATAVFMAGCITKVVEPEDIIEPEDLADIAEAYCLAHPELTCGHVYMCDAAADNALGHVEICLLDEFPLTTLTDLYGSCVPTPRHQGLCWWCCGEGCTSGCNAYDGCYCPPPPPPPPDAMPSNGPLEIPPPFKGELK